MLTAPVAERRVRDGQGAFLRPGQAGRRPDLVKDARDVHGDRSSYHVTPTAQRDIGYSSNRISAMDWGG